MSVRFQKRLNQLHTEALFNIETQALPSLATERDIGLLSIIDGWRLTHSSLEHECPTSMGKHGLVERSTYGANNCRQVRIIGSNLANLAVLFLPIEGPDRQLENPNTLRRSL